MPTRAIFLRFDLHNQWESSWTLERNFLCLGSLSAIANQGPFEIEKYLYSIESNEEYILAMYDSGGDGIGAPGFQIKFEEGFSNSHLFGSCPTPIWVLSCNPAHRACHVTTPTSPQPSFQPSAPPTVSPTAEPTP
jgi:hypothetical protein